MHFFFFPSFCEEQQVVFVLQWPHRRPPQKVVVINREWRWRNWLLNKTIEKADEDMSELERSYSCGY